MGGKALARWGDCKPMEAAKVESRISSQEALLVSLAIATTVSGSGQSGTAIRRVHVGFGGGSRRREPPLLKPLRPTAALSSSARPRG